MPYPVLPLSFLPQYDQYYSLEHSSQAIFPQSILTQAQENSNPDQPLPQTLVYRIYTPYETETFVTPHFLEGIEHIYLNRRILEALVAIEPYPQINAQLLNPPPPQATFIQLQPETEEFATLPNLDPRQVLEDAFRHSYHVLTSHQPLTVPHGDKIFYFQVTQTKSGTNNLPCVLLTDTEPEVDFLPAINNRPTPQNPPTILQPPATTPPITPKPPTPPPATRPPLPPPLQIPDPPQYQPGDINVPDIPLQPSLPSGFDSDSESEGDPPQNPSRGFIPFSGKGNKLGS